METTPLGKLPSEYENTGTILEGARDVDDPNPPGLGEVEDIVPMEGVVPIDENISAVANLKLSVEDDGE